MVGTRAGKRELAGRSAKPGLEASPLRRVALSSSKPSRTSLSIRRHANSAGILRTLHAQPRRRVHLLIAKPEGRARGRVCRADRPRVRALRSVPGLGVACRPGIGALSSGHRMESGPCSIAISRLRVVGRQATPLSITIQPTIAARQPRASARPGEQADPQPGRSALSSPRPAEKTGGLSQCRR